MKKMITLAVLTLWLICVSLYAADYDFLGYVIVRNVRGTLTTHAACIDSFQFKHEVNKLAEADVDSGDLWFFEEYMYSDLDQHLSVPCTSINITDTYRPIYQAFEPFSSPF